MTGNFAEARVAPCKIVEHMLNMFGAYRKWAKV